MNIMNPKVDWYFEKDSQLAKEFEKLRTIILNTGLMEELKCGCPCYIFENPYIVLIHCIQKLLVRCCFLKGASLQDAEKAGEFSFTTKISAAGNYVTIYEF